MDAMLMRREAPKMDLTTRAFRLAPETFDDASRTVAATFATEAPVKVYDWNRGEVIDEVLLMGGMIAPASRQVPLLDTHGRDTIDNLIGSARDISAGDGKAPTVLHFVDTPEGRDAAAKVKGGHLTDVSVGYKVLEWTDARRGEEVTVAGRTFKASADRPLRIVSKWEVKEISLCAIGADPDAKMRKEHPDFLREEETRVAAIRAMSTDGLEAVVERCVADGSSVVEARAALLAEVRRKGEVTVGQSCHSGVSIGEDLNRSTFAQGVTDALLLRESVPLVAEDAAGVPVVGDSGPMLRQAHPRARQFMGRRVPDLVRTMLAANGDTAAAEYSDRKAIKTALELSVRGGLPSTYNLADLLSNVAGKSLLASYVMYPVQWVKFAKRVTHKDFKTITRVRLLEVTGMESVGEGGEYKHTTISDDAQTYQLLKYGRIFGITFESVVNDDLGALVEVPKKMAEMARRLEDQIVFAVLTANGNMGDGVALFHSTHANLGTGAISVTSLNAAKLKFRKQVSKSVTGGETEKSFLNTEPKVMIVPAAIEGTARTFLESEYDPDDAAGKTSNIWKGKLELCVHPLLDLTSAAEWYLSAGVEHGGIEMCFLDGQTAPHIERENSFEIDAVRFKVRHVCAAAAIDHRPLYKSSGS